MKEVTFDKATEKAFHADMMALVATVCEMMLKGMKK